MRRPSRPGGPPPKASRERKVEIFSGMLSPALADPTHQTEAVQALLELLAEYGADWQAIYEKEAALHNRVFPKNPAPSLEAVVPSTLRASLRPSGDTTNP